VNAVIVAYKLATGLEKQQFPSESNAGIAVLLSSIGPIEVVAFDRTYVDRLGNVFPFMIFQSCFFGGQTRHAMHIFRMHRRAELVFGKLFCVYVLDFVFVPERVYSHDLRGLVRASFPGLIAGSACLRADERKFCRIAGVEKARRPQYVACRP